MFKILKRLLSRKKLHEVEMERWDTTTPKKDMVQDTLSFDLEGQRTLDEWGKEE